MFLQVNVQRYIDGNIHCYIGHFGFSIQFPSEPSLLANYSFFYSMYHFSSVFTLLF